MKTLPRKTWMVTGALGALALTGAVVAGGAAADTPSPSPTSLIDTVPVPTDTNVPADDARASAVPTGRHDDPPRLPPTRERGSRQAHHVGTRQHGQHGELAGEPGQPGLGEHAERAELAGEPGQPAVGEHAELRRCLR